MPRHSASTILDHIRVEFDVDDLDIPFSLFDPAQVQPHNVQPHNGDGQSPDPAAERKEIEQKALQLGIVK